MSRFCRAADAGEFAWEEIPFDVYQLFTPGTETTAYTIGMTLLQLLDERSRWERWLAEPQLFPAIREEGLRYTAAIRVDLRLTTQDTEITGVAVPAGTRLVLSLAAANRDESEPDRFALDRGDEHRHLAFGTGVPAEPRGELCPQRTRAPRCDLVSRPAPPRRHGCWQCRPACAAR